MKFEVPPRELSSRTRGIQATDALADAKPSAPTLVNNVQADGRGDNSADGGGYNSTRASG